MFSPSGNNNNNIPYHHHHHHQLALPFYPYSSSTHPFISHDTNGSNNNILYHYYQHPLLAGQQLLPGYVVPESTSAADIAALNNSITGVVATNGLPEKPVKKDRHSKIYTAHGLRDRRVRLSTEISRQFFDLQDLLGYDKASETIAWLLSKSKKDIKELVEMKTKCLSSPSNSEIFPLSNHVAENAEHDGIASQVESLTGTSIERKVKSKRAAAFQLLRKDSRTTKARENMCLAERNHELNQARSTGHSDVSEKPGSLGGFAEFGGKSTDSVAYNQLAREDIMGESIMITRKLKPVSSSLGYHQHSFSCIPEKWDMNGAISASSYYATSSMNLPTEVLIPGKAWEACNSGCLE